MKNEVEEYAHILFRSLMDVGFRRHILMDEVDLNKVWRNALDTSEWLCNKPVFSYDI